MFVSEQIYNLVVGIQHDDKILIALAMSHIAGEYLEGCSKAAQNVFNEVWNSNALTQEQRQCIIDSLPWECIANSLATETGLALPHKHLSDETFPFWERIRPNPLEVSKNFEDYRRLLELVSRR